MNWLIGSWLVMTCLLSWNSHALADITPIDNIIPELAELEAKAKALEEKENPPQQETIEAVKKAQEKPAEPEPAPVVAQAAPPKKKVRPKKKPPVVVEAPTPAVVPPVVDVKAPPVNRKPKKPVEAPVDPWLLQDRQYSFP